MLRALVFLSLVLALTAAGSRAHSDSFALTRITDNSWDDMPAVMDRILVLDPAARPSVVFVGWTPGGTLAVYHAWKPDDWVVQAIAEDTYGLRDAVAAQAGDTVHVVHCRWAETGTWVDHVQVIEGVPGTPEAICPEDPGLSGPSVAVGPGGMVHVVYSSGDSVCHVQREEGGWSPPERLAEGRFAALAVAPDGECHVVYQRWDAQWTSSVWYLHGRAGAWSPPEHLAGESGLDAGYPSIAVDPQGDVHTAYEQLVPDDRVIDYRGRVSGTWSAADRVASGQMPAIAVTSGGHPCVAFWAGWPGAGVAVAIRDLPVVRPSSPDWYVAPVDPEARIGSELALRPGIAQDLTGAIHVAYDSRDPRGGEDAEMWYAKVLISTDVSEPGLVAGGALSCRPNPTRGSLAVRWALVAPAWTRVAVSDVSGRLVRTLREGPLAEGEHAATWDGRDSHGRPVPAGVYCVRVSAGGAEAVRRVVMLGR